MIALGADELELKVGSTRRVGGFARGLGLAVSRGHGVGAVEFSGQKFPAPHATAGDEALGQYVPGRQVYEKFQTRSELPEKP